jgi:hypothetical protein
MLDDHRYHKPHPYDDPEIAPHRDYWIDTFRRVFPSDSQDAQKVLWFLAKHWHFFDRRLACEEWVVQRQCFIELLMCLGLWGDDIWEQGLGKLAQPAKMPVALRIRLWFRGLLTLRTARDETKPEPGRPRG